MNQSGRVAASAVCVAFGVALPMVFHIVGMAGSILLPMHIPVMIAGLFLGTRPGLLVGGFTPVISCLLTGMPPMMPLLPIMMAELAAYGCVGGYLYRERHLPIRAALLGAVAAGRIVAASGAFMMASMLNIDLSPFFYVTGAVIKGLPGIVLQFILVPMIVNRLEKVFYRTSMSKMDVKQDGGFV